MLCLLGFGFQGTRSLWEPDEGRYTAVALEMIHSGDYLVPRLNEHQEHFTKPPLAYWAIAASLHLFGDSTWAVRLPYALAFVVNGLLVFALGRRFVPSRPWLPAFVWGSSLLAVLAANVVSTDVLLVPFETAAVLAWLRGREDGRGRWFVAMWLALGFGFLTKGPPALLPLLPILVWTAAVDGRRALGRLFPWHGLALFAATGLGWFAWLLAQRPELLGYFLGYELVDRVFSDIHDRNAQWYGAFKIYLPVLLMAALPWAVIDARWLRTLAGSFRPSIWRHRFANDPERAFLLLWLLLPLLLFFVARSRLFLYVLPLAVPMALLIARALSSRIDPASDPFWRVALPVWALLVLAAKATLVQLPSHKDAREEAERLLSAVARPPERILFLGQPAHYGLRFYTGIPVEQVDARPRHSMPAATSDDELCADLARYPDALLVVSPALDWKPSQVACARLAEVRPASGLWQRTPVVADDGATAVIAAARHPTAIDSELHSTTRQPPHG